MAGQETKNMTIITNKSANDDRSYSSMSESQDRGCIPSKNLKKNYLRIQSQGIK